MWIICYKVINFTRNRISDFLNVIGKKHSSYLADTAGTSCTGHLVHIIIKPLPTFFARCLCLFDILNYIWCRFNGNITELISKWIEMCSAIRCCLYTAVCIDFQKSNIFRLISNRCSCFIRRENHSCFHLIFDTYQRICSTSSKTYKQNCTSLICRYSGSSVIDSSIF